MLKKLVFSIENISNISESNDPNFTNVTIDALSDGPNHHNLIISEETLRLSADSIYEVPIVFKYDPWKDNLMGHEPDEIPCGFISKIDNPIQFVKLSDNRTMLRVLGKIWKRYSGKLIDILKRDGGKKAVSVEMEVLDFDEIKSEIKEFAMRAVTIIGTEPAIPDAGLTVLSFEKDKEDYYQKFAGKFKIDNSLESADMTDNAWVNSGRKLYGKFIDSSQAELIAKEAYLVVKDGWKDSPSDSKLLGYPHHRWNGDTLIVVKKGIQSAFARYKQQGGNDKSVLAHIEKHYKELNLDGLDIGNFSTEIEKEENELEDKENVMMEEEKKEEKMTVEEEKKEEGAKEEEKMAVYESEKEPEMKKEDKFGCDENVTNYQEKLKEYSVKFEVQEKELSELRKFKADREAEEVKYTLEKLFSDIGESLSKDKLEEFRFRSEKITLPEVAAFSNEVKAATFDVEKNIKPESAVLKMSISKPAEIAKKSVWSF